MLFMNVKIEKKYGKHLNQYKSGKQQPAKYLRLERYKHWKENQETNNDNKHYHNIWDMESTKSVQARNKISNIKKNLKEIMIHY